MLWSLHFSPFSREPQKVGMTTPISQMGRERPRVVSGSSRGSEDSAEPGARSAGLQLSATLVQGPASHSGNPSSLASHRSTHHPSAVTHLARPRPQETVLSPASAVRLENTWKFICTKRPRTGHNSLLGQEPFALRKAGKGFFIKPRKMDPQEECQAPPQAARITPTQPLPSMSPQE